MGVMGASFQIGRSALAAYQAALTVTGQNIANVGNPDYARQSGHLRTIVGQTGTGGVAPGSGVQIKGLQRHMDQALESRLRLSIAQKNHAETNYNLLRQIESLYNELTDQDLSTGMSAMFNAFGELQNSPQDNTIRDLIVGQADAVIDNLKRLRNGLIDESEQMNDTVQATVSRVNEILDEVAQINESIVVDEATSSGVNGALRDRRDALLRELSEYMDIDTRELSNGAVNVYTGSQPLVDFDRARTLVTETEIQNELETSIVRFEDNQGRVPVQDGKLGGLLEARDEHLMDQLEGLDKLAQALIYEVNRAHTTGEGLVGYTDVTGTYAVKRTDLALNQAATGLTYPVENGTFLVKVRDERTGQVTTRQINVDLDGLGGNDTTLKDLAAALNAVPSLSASITADNRLHLETLDGTEVSFSEDSSGALAALGIATFFEGTNASNIDVNGMIREDRRLIAASLDGSDADGSNAGRLAAVGTVASDFLSGTSINEFHDSMINTLAVKTSQATTIHDASDAVYSSLMTQREGISGVSLDEEALNLTKYERAFQGASRFLSTVDRLTAEVIALLR